MEVASAGPPGRTAKIELMMAVWTPGSYLVREFSRNVEALSASTELGEPLGREDGQNRWRIATRRLPIAVRYRVYSREMSGPPTGWTRVRPDHALPRSSPGAGAESAPTKCGWFCRWPGRSR